MKLKYRVLTVVILAIISDTILSFYLLHQHGDLLICLMQI